MNISNKKHGYLWSLLNLKCPNCREGNIFQDKSSYKLKNFLKMNDNCPICGHQLKIEKEFYYAPTFVSYGFSIAISLISFFVWWLTIGFSVDDNRIFWWLLINGILIMLLQPYILRFSRSVWLSFSIRYDADWKSLKPGSVNSETKQAQKDQ